MLLPTKATLASVCISLLTSTTLGQFVPAPTDLKSVTGYYNQPVRYKEVPPGICELTPGVKSYSGYVDIAEHEHVFFWFFEARNADPKTAPLTVWINGGPGSSSMIGLFQELSPCGVDYNGNVYNNPYAWNNVSNMIFIDHPSQVGFSYSIPVPAYTDIQDSYENIIQLPNNSCPDYAAATGTCGTYSYPNTTLTPNSTLNAAPSMWKTLQGFMGAFPQYSRHEFNFATESYGGHYGPIFNEYIEQQNDLIKKGRLPGAHHIDLKTVLIGNGWFDPLLQYEAYYSYLVSPGNTYDYTPLNSTIQNQMYNALYGPGNCADQTRDCYATGTNEVCSNADNFCAQEVESALDIYGGRDDYDIREPLEDDPFPYSFFVDYLNTPEVQHALGAYVNYSTYSIGVGNAFASTGDDDRQEDTLADMRDLVKRGKYVVQYVGDADYICNWLGNLAVAESISTPGFSSAGFTNLTTPSTSIVNGQVRQSANFAFVRVYQAGHEVPFYQPELALTMFSRAISHVDIATGKHHITVHQDYKTTGPRESTYREGNSTFVYADLPPYATYNTSIYGPNPVGNDSTIAAMAAAKRTTVGAVKKGDEKMREVHRKRAILAKKMMRRNKNRGGWRRAARP